MVLKNFNEIINLVKQFPVRKKCGVVAADEHAIEAALAAEEAGLADPVFIGNPLEISLILQKMGIEKSYQIVESTSLTDSAEKGVALAREGKVDFLLKGHIDTSVLLKAVVNKENGLGTGKLMTHFVFNEIPTYHKLLVTTDGGMVTYPDVDAKQKIIENTVEVLHKLGYENPKIACLAAVEKLNPKMPETVDAEELKRRNQEGILTGCIVEGPISFDLAYDRSTAVLKDYHSPVAGDADVLLVPNITAGNILGKSLVYAAGGRMAGFIVGAKCPIILTSRSSTADEKFLSIALSALLDA
ncbi:MAG: phosphate acyltransferase [Clostridiaceae bacterium]